MITSMIAASTKRMRLVVAGPKLSLASLYAGRLPPKNTTIVSNVARTASVAGCEGGPTTAVIGSLIATAQPYSLPVVGADPVDRSATVTGVPGSLVGEIQETP